MNQFRTSVFLLFVTFILLSSCQTEKSTSGENDDRYSITTRISQEPNSLFPYFTTSSVASGIERLLFQSLMEIDPRTLELVPVLASEKPVRTTSNDTIQLDFKLRNDVEWGNGESLSAQDVKFTLKLALIPGFDKSGINTYLRNIISFKIKNKFSFSIKMKNASFLSEEAFSTLAIIPRAVYDSSRVLSAYSIEELNKMEAPDEALQSLTESIGNLINVEQVYVGSNAYQLDRWTRQQGIKLTRKSDWWADKSSSSTEPKAYPSEIIFAIIPNDGTALIAFKNDQCDILVDVDPRDFKALKTSGEKYKFYTTTPFRYYYLCMNNKDELLKDKTLRKALAYCFDAKRFIQVQMDSMGTLVHSPIHPSSIYFLEDTTRNRFDLEKARTILVQQGYMDSDGNGILENPAGQEISLTILISGGDLGKTMALLLKQNARKIEIEITIETMKFAEIRQRLSTKNYQITPLVLSTSPFRYDPYQSWHSDNSGLKESNFSGFTDSLADNYIEIIRSTESEEKRMQAYRGFQRRLQEQMPVIFVAAPVRCIVTQAYIEVPVTPLRYACDLMRARKLNVQ